MPSEKITAMPTAGPLDGEEWLPIVQGGVNKKVKIKTIRDWIFAAVGEGEFLFKQFGLIAGDPAIFRVGAGQLQADILKFTNSCRDLASNVWMNSTGSIFANVEVVSNHVVDTSGLTFTGSITNLTTQNGIVTFAS